MRRGTWINLVVVLGLVVSAAGVPPAREPLVWAAQAQTATILYVKPAASGSGHCGDWDNACALQTALGAANAGDEIWVAAGIHKPGTVSTDTFQLRGGVAIYGGFVATETLRTQRDWAAHSTVLSGDIDDNDLTDPFGVVTDTANIAGDNAWTVVTGSGVTETAVLDGFTVSAGNANGTDADCSYWEPCQNGGGMYNTYGSSPTLANVTFHGNAAVWYGGGMYNEYYSSPALTNVTFHGNSGSDGGGMLNYSSSNPKLVNVTFHGNEARDGGGMCNENGSSPKLTNVTFGGNSATYSGGGMRNYDTSSPTLSNVTFHGNAAVWYGGGMYNDDSIPTIDNSILWANTATSGPQIWNQGASVPTISHSDVQGGCANIPGNDCGTGNIDADPHFVDADGADDIAGTADDNLRLVACSPAIDAGDNSAVPPGVTTDLDGHPRFVDIPARVDTGNGTPPIVDMGAYEAQLAGAVFVDAGATGANSGGSWADAFTDLQDALSCASAGGEIWVAEGTYTPGTNRTDTFHLVSGVAIYGGFAGAETLRTQRDWAAHPTVLSGDIGVGGDANDNSHHVVTGSGVTETAALDGFIISGGNANGSPPYDRGGGMFNESGSPTLTDVTFHGNTANCCGGGMYNYVSSPTLVNVTFSGNTANDGGGMYNGLSNPTLTNVTLSGNTANDGGGMYNDDSSPTLVNVTLSGNSANDDGGAMFNGGDPLLGFGSHPTLIGCILWGNAAPNGPQIDDDGTSSAAVTCSDVQGGWTGSGNIDADPLFVAPVSATSAPTTTGNYRLLPGSPAIDAGDSSALPPGVTTDLDGHPRIVGPAVDMGPYEAQVDLSILKSVTPGTVSPGQAVTYTLSFSSSGAYTATGVVISDHIPISVTHASLSVYSSGAAITRHLGTTYVWDVAPLPAGQGGTITITGILSPALTGPCDVVNVVLVSGTGDLTPTHNTASATFHVPGVLYVDADATGAATGLSWTDAFTEVQAALALAHPGDEIWVAEGIYYPDYNPALRAHTRWVTATFALPQGVALYGGFDPGSGVEAPHQRDPATYVTVLSGDLDRNDTTDPNGVVTDTANISGVNAWTVVTGSGVTETVLDGFAVTAGNANGTDADCSWSEPCRSGGGMYNTSGSSPALTDVTFTGNTADGGGGMYNSDSSPALVNVTFSGNTAAGGGGMYNYVSSPTLRDVTFRGNTAADGGGMYNYVSSPTLRDVTFRGNSASSGGGGMSNIQGSSPTLVNVTFSGNTATGGYGGGMRNDYVSSPALVNVTFSGNTADGGGGMYNYVSSPTLVNVTFGGNSANDDGGAMFNACSWMGECSHPTLIGCILWGNTARGIPDQISNDSPSSAAVTYSDVQGGCTGSGNIDADPLFVAPVSATLAPTTTGNYRLRPGSPAIDAGDNSALPPGVTTDLDGHPRIVGLAVDMGPYEAQVDLLIHKSVAAPSMGSGQAITVTPGQAVTYTLSFSSSGAYTATGVVISDHIPAGVTHASLSVRSSGAAITRHLGTTYVWDVAPLPPGQGATITISGVLSEPLAAGSITNTARIACASAESDARNNSTSAVVTVQNVPPLAVDDSGYSTKEDTSLTVSAPGVLGNDADANGGPLTAVLDADPVVGTVVLYGDGSFVYTPAPDDSGAITFTYHASDGTASSNTATVTITVDAVNDAPTVSDIPDQNAEQDTVVGPLPFTIGDVETDPASLALSAGSSNVVLVPPSSIGFGGSGANRTVTITPTAGITGTTTITITVDDGAQTASDTFVLTVTERAGWMVYLPAVVRNKR